MRKTAFDDSHFTDPEGCQVLIGRPSGKVRSKRSASSRKCTVLRLGSGNSFKWLFLLSKGIREACEVGILLYCGVIMTLALGRSTSRLRAIAPGGADPRENSFTIDPLCGGTSVVVLTKVV